MPDEDPTFSSVGERNIRERAERTGEPVDYLLNYLESKYERM
jgi:hypothetical protein